MKTVTVFLLFLSANVYAGEKEDLSRVEKCANEMITLRRSANESAQKVNNRDALDAEVKRDECKRRSDDFKKTYNKKADCRWDNYGSIVCKAK